MFVIYLRAMGGGFFLNTFFLESKTTTKKAFLFFSHFPHFDAFFFVFTVFSMPLH